MKLLRDDLIIEPAEDSDNKFIVKDPLSDELFEFGEKEHYLLNELKRPYHEKVLLTKYNAKFGENESSQFIGNFIAMLEEWGLIGKDGETDNNIPDTDKKKEYSPQLEKRKHLNHWSLFNPEKLLDKLNIYFGFFRFLIKLLLFVFILSLLALLFNFNLFRDELLQVTSKFTIVEHLIFTMFTISLFSQIVKGCVARFYNINTPSFGLMLAYGIIPRFDMRVDIKGDASRNSKLWLTSSSLLVRISLFSFGVLLWLISRSSGTALSVSGAAVAFFSMISLLFVANPLLSSDGYRFITIYFNMPNIREKAIRSIRNTFLPTPDVIAKYTDDRLALKIYGSLSILFIVSLILFLGYSIGRWLETNYRGLGVVILVGIFIYLLFRFRHLSKTKKNLQAGNPSGEKSPLAEKEHMNPLDKQKSAAPSKFRRLPFKVNLLRCFIIVLIVVALFLPYRYEAGGSAEVLPVLHRQIYPEKKGIIKKVYYKGGEWLKKGTLIAEMENYREKKEVDLTEQSVKRKQEEINILLTTPSDEERELARQQLAAAKLQLQYSKKNYYRLESLYKKNVASLETYLDAKEKMDLDRQNVREKEASLDVVENQVNEHKLESAKLELEMLRKELHFYEEQLEKTRLRMPGDGKIITMNLKNLENKFLDDAQLFAEIEDSRQVKVEIMIPESDVDQVKPGNSVRFRALLSPNVSFTGKVSTIYPAMDSTSYGKVLKVVSVISNEENILKTGMTGYAKVEGRKMFVFQAFSRSLISFFLIEFWSWLP